MHVASAPIAYNKVRSLKLSIETAKREISALSDWINQQAPNTVPEETQEKAQKLAKLATLIDGLLQEFE